MVDLDESDPELEAIEILKDKFGDEQEINGLTLHQCYGTLQIEEV